MKTMHHQSRLIMVHYYKHKQNKQIANKHMIFTDCIIRKVYILLIRLLEYS